MTRPDRRPHTRGQARGVRESGPSPETIQIRLAPAGGETVDDDLDLISRLVQQDAGAWRVFVERYQRLVFARVTCVVSGWREPPDRQLVEDITAEVFAMLLANDCANLRQFQGRSRLSTWLDVIARRVALRQLTRVATRAHHETGSESLDINLPPAAGAAAAESPVETAEERERCAAALSRLQEADRRVLEMFYYERRSYLEIAADLGLSVNAVGPKLHRAHARLRRELTETGSKGSVSRTSRPADQGQ